jgi:hypothetical protein
MLAALLRLADAYKYGCHRHGRHNNNVRNKEESIIFYQAKRSQAYTILSHFDFRTWPRLQRLAVTVGIAADPRDLIPTLVSDENTKQTAPLAAFFTLIENAMNHQINQADADNLDWQTKVATLQVKVDDLTNALTHLTGRGRGSGPGRRISDDPDKFGGTEKDIAKRQQEYVYGVHKFSVASAWTNKSSTPSSVESNISPASSRTTPTISTENVLRPLQTTPQTCLSGIGRLIRASSKR